MSTNPKYTTDAFGIRTYPPCRRTIKIDFVEYGPHTRVPRRIIVSKTFNLPFPRHSFYIARDWPGPVLMARFHYLETTLLPFLLPNIQHGRVCLGDAPLNSLDDAISQFWYTAFYEDGASGNMWPATNAVLSFFSGHTDGSRSVKSVIEGYQRWSEITDIDPFLKYVSAMYGQPCTGNIQPRSSSSTA